MIDYLRADKNDTAQLKKLWLECFDDTEQAVDLFFDRNKQNMRAFCAKDNDKVVSALYLLDVTLNGQKAHYLCGASTKADYRKKGIMSGLIKFSLENAVADSDKFSVLMPAKEPLYDYYARLGYKSECFAQKRIYSRKDLLSFSDCSSEKICDFEALQRISFDNNFLLWNNKFKNFACDYYRLYGTTVINTSDCFALFDENNGCADVFYAVSTSKSVLAKRLLENSSAERFCITDKANKSSDKEKYGMIKSLYSNIKIPENVFIGITLM